MKPFYSISLSLILVLIFIPVRAQHHMSVTLNASMDQYLIECNTKGICKLIALEEDHHYPGKAHMPALPLRMVSIIVPPGAELVDYHFSLEQELVKDQIILSEAPVAFPLNANGSRAAKSVAFDGSFPDTPS